MSRRSAKAFDAFIKALVMTDQEHAAEVLNPTLTAQLVRERDAKRNPNNSTIAQASSSNEQSRVEPSPSASPVVTTSSSAAQKAPSSPVQCTPPPTGMC